MNKAILWDMGYTIMANMDQMCDTKEAGVWATHRDVDIQVHVALLRNDFLRGQLNQISRGGLMNGYCQSNGLGLCRRAKKKT